MSTETHIKKLENGFLLEEYDGDDFGKPPRRRVAKDKGELAKFLGVHGEELLPSVPLTDGGKDG